MCAEQTTKKATAGHIVVVTVLLLSADHMPRSTCPTATTWFRTRQDAQVAPMMCDCAPKAIQARIPCRKAGSHSALSAMMLPCSSSCSIPPIPSCPFKHRRSLSIPVVRNRPRIRSRNYITLSHPGTARVSGRIKFVLNIRPVRFRRARFK